MPVITNKYKMMSIILPVSLILACSSGTQRARGPAWVIHMPREWELREKGSKKGLLSYALYKRLPVAEDDGTSYSPTCIISNEYRNSEIDLAQTAADSEACIFKTFQCRGYHILTMRKDIMHELKTAFRTNNIICLVYDYYHEKTGRRYLLINVYAEYRANLLAVEIETSLASYKHIRKELYQIISSIK